jgi:hypothetical protein
MKAMLIPMFIIRGGFFLLALATLQSTAFAQTTAFTYQGRLIESNAPANGSFEFKFALLDAPNASTNLGIVTVNQVGVSNGLFAVLLDFGPGAFTGMPRWLGITVRSEAPGGSFVSLPSQSLTATPYAIYAGKAKMLDGALPGDQLSGTYFNALTFNNAANSFSGNGAGLTALNASQLSVGTVPNGRLDASVSLFGQSIESAEIGDGTIMNADINATAAIADTKLATIFTAGKVANSATTAGINNAPNTIVLRDATGSFNASNVNAVYLSSTDNSITNGVTGVMVKQTNNTHRTANATAIATFAANACGSSNPGPTCASPEAIGQIGWGGSTSRSGALPAGGSAERWFTVSFANSGASYHPHVYLVPASRLYYTLDIFVSCAGGIHEIGTFNWETLSTVTLPVGTQIFVRVRPYTANPTCQSFTVVFQNG